MIRCLAISLLWAVTASCSLKTTEGLRQVAFVHKEITNPYFSNPELDYVYKAQIEVYKRNFGGILIIKKTGGKNYRIVMTSEFGSKLFDFQLNDGNFTKNFIVEDLDRKFIIDVLQDDFKLLLSEKATVVTAYRSPESSIYKTKDGDDFNFYFFANTTERLEKIVNTTKIKEKTAIEFSVTRGDIAEHISIQHYTIKLKIDLQKFKNE